jgi:transcriptional regulator with XRE-family HTH domain
MKKSIFSQNLIKARKLKGWSQEGAAAAIREAGAENFKRSTLGSYEESRAEPSHDTLNAICIVFNIQDLKGFLTDAKFFESKTSPEELHSRYHKLPAPLKKVVDLLLGITY